MVERRWCQWRHILPGGVVLSLELYRLVEASFLAWWQRWWSSSSSSCLRFMSPSSVSLLRSLQFGGCFAALLVEVCFGRILCRLSHALWVDALPPILCLCGCFAAMVFGSRLPSWSCLLGGCFGTLPRLGCPVLLAGCDFGVSFRLCVFFSVFLYF